MSPYSATAFANMQQDNFKDLAIAQAALPGVDTFPPPLRHTLFCSNYGALYENASHEALFFGVRCNYPFCRFGRMGIARQCCYIRLFRGSVSASPSFPEISFAGFRTVSRLGPTRCLCG